jgi:hypothetical protein
VHVVALDRVVHEPEPTTRVRSAERALELTHDSRKPERGQAAPQTQRHVARRVGGAGVPAEMGNARPGAPPSSGSGPPPAPPTRTRELEQELMGRVH